MTSVPSSGPPGEDKRVVELTPDAAVALARRIHQDGDPVEARSMYLQVLENTPDHVDALNFYGVLCFQHFDKAEGLRLLQRCVQVAPGYHDAHANLGLALLTIGMLAEADVFLERAIELDPAPMGPRLNLSLLRRRQGRFDEALAMLRALRDEDPQNALVLNAMANLARSQGLEDEANEHLRMAAGTSNLVGTRLQMVQALAAAGKLELARSELLRLMQMDPGNAQFAHILSAIGGAPAPDRARDEYVVDLFDAFAETFDGTLAKLGYRVPEQLTDLFTRTLGDGVRVGSLLDAGCGTGLLGQLLRARVGVLDGVDLSPGMLEKARARGVYDQLVHAELTQHLHTVPGRYEVVTIADTFCYFGEIGEAVQAAHGALVPGGWLLFSVEDGKDQAEPYQLHFHGRYSHRADYVRTVLDRAGFTGIVMETAILRQEGSKPVAGLLCVGRRPA